MGIVYDFIDIIPISPLNLKIQALDDTGIIAHLLYSKCNTHITVSKSKTKQNKTLLELPPPPCPHTKNLRLFFQLFLCLVSIKQGMYGQIFI